MFVKRKTLNFLLLCKRKCANITPVSGSSPPISDLKGTGRMVANIDVFQAQVNTLIGSSDTFLQRWILARDEWINAKAAISGSEATRRAYTGALDAFWSFCDVNPDMICDERKALRAYAMHPEGDWRQPWMVSSVDAVSFRVWMEEKAPATIAQFMSIVSSFFQHVINCTFMSPQGIEVSLFMDARGITRANPFRHSTVSRPKVDPYDKSLPTPKEDLQEFFAAIEQDHRPLVRSRDKALFSIYLLTGRRAAEVVGLRWRDIKQISPGRYEFAYVGKGYGRGYGDNARQKKQTLPESSYLLLIEYLKADGRWPNIAGSEYIFRPISDSGTKNFSGVDVGSLAQNRHIAVRRVGQIMDKICKRAGIAHMHPHQFRHVFAQELYDLTKDIRLVQTTLGHEHLSTTQIYLAAMEPKEDTYSRALIERLGLKL